MGNDDWKLMAVMSIEGILERNENGNLYPLTSTEITILTDIRETLAGDNGAEPTPAPAKKQPATKPAKEATTTKDKKSEFKKLDGQDLTG